MTGATRPAAEDEDRRISLVLPLRVDGARAVSDLDRFVGIGLPSLERFVDRAAVRELLVVTPPEDRAAARRAIRTSAFAVRVADDDLACPAASTMRGWHKQQIVKLGAAALVATEWYLTLDADVVCVRPLDLAFLFPGGRAIRQHEPAAVHADWWRGSRELLGSARDLAAAADVFGVTPALLHAPTVRDLTARISRIDPSRSWAAHLAARTDLAWTEYSLYWTHLADTGGASRLHDDSARQMYSARSVWDEAQAARLGSDVLDRVFDAAAEHAFFVYQSRIDDDLTRIASLLRPRLGLPPELPFGVRGRVRLRAAVAKLKGARRLTPLRGRRQG